MGGEADEAPVDPFTAMAEAATAMHELWKTFVDAGFTEAQALYLVGVVHTANVHKPPGAS